MPLGAYEGQGKDEEVIMKKLLSAVGIGAIAALVLTGCGAPAASTPTAQPSIEVDSVDSLVAAAKAEGSLRVYGQIPEAEMKALTDGFSSEYGITVESLRLGGNTLSSRFESEVQAGTPSADILIAVDTEFLSKAAAAGHLEGFSKTGVRELIDGFPEQAVLTDFDAPIAQIVNVGFIYNTSKVQSAEIPAAWSDLESERWKGKYCAVDPTTSVNVAHFFWDMQAASNDAALEAFGENIGRWYPNIVAMNEAVAVGECELGLNSAEFFVNGAIGTGAKVAYADQPSRIPPLTSASVATAAEHPNAARLFLHYMLSEEPNRILSGPDKGAIGPWDVEMLPAADELPRPTDFQEVRDATNELVSLLGL